MGNGWTKKKSPEKKDPVDTSSDNKCSLGFRCTLYSCELEHPRSRTKPCTFNHPGPESQARCSFLHTEDNNEHYLRIHKRIQDSDGSLKEVLELAFRLLSTEVQGVAILSAGEGAGKTSQVPLYLNERVGGGPVLCAQSSMDIVRVDANRVATQYAQSGLDKSDKSPIGCLNKAKQMPNRQEDVLFTSEAILSAVLSEPALSQKWLQRDPVLVIDDALPLTKNRMNLYQKIQETLHQYPRMRLLLMTEETEVSELQRLFSSFSVAPLVIVPQD